MKKVKLMLVGLALVTTVGAAFAFKAHTMSGNLFCATTQNAGCDRDEENNLIKYQANPIGGALNIFCTTSAAQDCADGTQQKVDVNPR